MRTLFLLLAIFIYTSCSMRGGSDGAQMSSREVESLTKGWSPSSQEATLEMLKKYGRPEDSTKKMLVWSKVPPFRRIIVHRETVDHYFPILHNDVIEHVVSYRIPPEKAGDLLRFNGSISFNRTAGELSARSDSEKMSILALNLAAEIIDGKRRWDSARLEYGKQALDLTNGKKTQQSEHLQFSSQDHTADADQSSNLFWAEAQDSTPSSLSGRNGALRQAQEEEIAE